MATLDLIGASEAAKLLGLSRAGLNKRVNEGRLKAAARVGKRCINVFDRAEIEKLAREESSHA